MSTRQVVVVTGARAGVGRGTARRFAERGAAVALLARGKKGLAGAAEEVRAAVGTALVVPVDMAEHKEVHRGANVHVTMVQLPAVNTPQFDWVLSRLPRRPQPVPPIYQPELIARGIVHAADHPRRREYWVGGSTVATMIGNKFGAGLLDRYLARAGYDSRQTDEPVAPERPENLWEPADGANGRDFGAHGRFDDRSSSRPYQLWASEHHGLLAALGGAGVSAAVGLVALRRR